MEQKNDWVKSHFKELRANYAGKYVAVSRGRILASGTTAKEVLKKVEKEDLKKVRFVHVPQTRSVFY